MRSLLNTPRHSACEPRQPSTPNVSGRNRSRDVRFRSAPSREDGKVPSIQSEVLSIADSERFSPKNDTLNQMSASASSEDAFTTPEKMTALSDITPGTASTGQALSQAATKLYTRSPLQQRSGQSSSGRITKLAYSQVKIVGPSAWQHAQASSMKRRIRTSSASTKSYDSPPFPPCWTPIPEPDPIRIQQSLTSFPSTSTIGSSERHRRPRQLSEVNSYRVQLLYSGSAEFVPRLKKQGNIASVDGAVTQKSVRSNAEILLGRDIKKEDIKESVTRVIFSTQYFQSNNPSSTSVAAKGKGIVVGIDADGLMTHVRWQNGIVEYCCTGFGNLYFLALADPPIIPEKITPEQQMRNWMEIAKNSPFWDADATGLYLLPRQHLSRVKDLNDASWAVRILCARIKQTSEDSKLHSKLQEELEQAKKDLKALYEDRERLNQWIECKIDDVEFRIPPSTLAPAAAAAVGVSKISVLEELRRMVRREAEKDRRNTRREAEDAALREMLEKKAKTKKGVKKELEEKLQTLQAREQRKHMDPWTAICTASPKELDEVIQETFSLFDLDGSKSISAVEFEKALQSMAIDAPSDIVQLIVAKADKDGNGSLDFNEFKDLTTSMVHAAKYAQEQATKNAIRNQHMKRVFADHVPTGLLTALPQYSPDDGDGGKDRSFLEYLLDLLTRDTQGLNIQKQERRMRMTAWSSARAFSSSPDVHAGERPDPRRRNFDRRRSLLYSPLLQDQPPVSPSSSLKNLK